MIQDWQTCTDPDEKYRLYLLSPEWNAWRVARRTRASGMCERMCGRRGTECHHVTYERLYNERITDLLWLCGPCHDYVSRKSEIDPLDSQLTSVGVSGHSISKQYRLGLFVLDHVAICSAIAKLKVWNQWEYVYFDLFAGPGFLTNKPNVPGSPVIALQTMAGMEIPYWAHLFEKHPVTHGRLVTSVTGYKNASVYLGGFQDHLASIVDQLSRRLMRFGLIYADPNKLTPRDPSLFDFLKVLADHNATKYLDILVHVSATNYKRVRGTKKYRGAPRLIDELRRVGKKHIRLTAPAPRDEAQWIFALLTNFKNGDDSFGRLIGLHSITSEPGKQILDRINRTNEELAGQRPDGYLFHKW